MDSLPCGHVAYRDQRRACPHLLVEDPPGCFLVLTGEGMRYDLACPACADEPELASLLLTACEGCIARSLDYWSIEGWRGEPGVRHQDGPVAGTWTTAGCDETPINDRCLAALPTGWLALTADGLIEITDEGAIRRHGAVVLPDEEPSVWADKRMPALHTSPDGRFAAVATDHGAVGVVLDLRTGSVTLRLDRHDHHARTTPFPIAFADTVVIAATEWNRLDAFDAASGLLLTDRDTDHDFDYFHGALALSPSGRWLFDDGWVWQPVGIRMVIDVEAWLAGETYATEHGRKVGWYSEDWDQPVAWLDDETIAIQRLGVDDRTMIEGVQLVEVPTGQIVHMMAGPAGPMWSHNRLLYVSSAAGLEIWSPAEEARIGLIEGFRPMAQNSRAGALAELAGGRLRTWRP